MAYGHRTAEPWLKMVTKNGWPGKPVRSTEVAPPLAIAKWNYTPCEIKITDTIVHYLSQYAQYFTKNDMQRLEPLVLHILLLKYTSTI